MWRLFERSLEERCALLFCYVRVSLWWELIRDFQYNKVDQQGRREGRDVEAGCVGLSIRLRVCCEVVRCIRAERWGMCMVNFCRKNEVYIRPCASCCKDCLLQHLKDRTKLNIINSTLCQPAGAISLAESVPLCGFASNISYFLE